MVAQEVGVWSPSTSHEVRDNMMRIGGQHANAAERPGILFLVIIFASLITNQSRLLRAITKVNRTGTQLLNACDVSAATFTTFMHANSVAWTPDEVAGNNFTTVHAAARFASQSVLFCIVAKARKALPCVMLGVPASSLEAGSEIVRSL